MDWYTSTDIETEPVLINEAKNHILLETGMTAQDSEITDLITIARQKCEEYKSIAVAEKTIVFSFTPDDLEDGEIDIPVYPVIKVDELITIDVEGTESDPLELNANYYVFGQQRKSISINKTWFTVGVGQSDIGQYKATIKVGYGNTSPDAGEQQTEVLPKGFKLAVFKLVAQWYLNREDGVYVMTSEVKEILDGLFGLNTWLG